MMPYRKDQAAKYGSHFAEVAKPRFFGVWLRLFAVLGVLMSICFIQLHAKGDNCHLYK
jgi:hypothetical protein